MLSLFVVGLGVVFAGVLFAFGYFGGSLRRVPRLWIRRLWWCVVVGRSGDRHRRWKGLVCRCGIWLVTVGWSPVVGLGLGFGLAFAFAFGFATFIAFGLLLEWLG